MTLEGNRLHQFSDITWQWPRNCPRSSIKCI